MILSSPVVFPESVFYLGHMIARWNVANCKLKSIGCTDYEKFKNRIIDNGTETCGFSFTILYIMEVYVTRSALVRGGPNIL